jgi:hypothetical protein
MMKRTIQVILLVVAALALTVGALAAQEEGESRGFIEGRIFKDVNGDGRCVNTGVAGEDPIPNVNVQFVSSDEETVITHYSGPEGIFGLVAAGYSWWRVTVLPPAGWTVTSEPTIHVPVFSDSLAHNDVNFCLSQGATGQVSVGTARVVALLPQSGQASSPVLTWVAALGLGLVLIGLVWEVRRRWM